MSDTYFSISSSKSPQQIPTFFFFFPRMCNVTCKFRLILTCESTVRFLQYAAGHLESPRALCWYRRLWGRFIRSHNDFPARRSPCSLDSPRTPALPGPVHGAPWDSRSLQPLRALTARRGHFWKALGGWESVAPFLILRRGAAAAPRLPKGPDHPGEWGPTGAHSLCHPAASLGRRQERFATSLTFSSAALGCGSGPSKFTLFQFAPYFPPGIGSHPLRLPELAPESQVLPQPVHKAFLLCVLLLFGHPFFRSACHCTEEALKIILLDPTTPAASTKVWEALHSHWDKLWGKKTMFARTPVTRRAGAGFIQVIPVDGYLSSQSSHPDRDVHIFPLQQKSLCSG